MAISLIGRWLVPLLLACLALATAPGVAAPAPGKTFKLLILDSQFGNPYDEIRTELLKSLAGFGYVDGANLNVKLRVIGNDQAKGERLLADEAKIPYDAVYVGGTVATIVGKKVLYGKAQPVIFAAPTDPVGIGVIGDFTSAPVANFTGICYPVPVKSRFKFIKQLLPRVKRLGLIYADMPQSHSYNQWVRDLIGNDPEFKGIEVLFRPVPLITGENGDQRMAENALRHIEELDPLVDAFIKPNDQMGTRKPFAEMVFKHATKPLIGIAKDDVMGHWGATAVVYPSHTSIGRQAAEKIRALFQGTPIKDIKPEWPKTYGFAVDLVKAKRFGITVPVEVLQLSGENIVR